MRSRLLSIPAAAVLGVVLLTGCNNEGNTATQAPSTTNRATAAPSGAESPSALVLANANTATVEELTAAFTAAGIPEAERWAREVEMHRPYPASDGWSGLREELDKDGIDDATFTKITSVLQA